MVNTVAENRIKELNNMVLVSFKKKNPIPTYNFIPVLMSGIKPFTLLNKRGSIKEIKDTTIEKYIEYRNALIKKDKDNFFNLNKEKIKAISNMIDFFNSITDDEFIKFPVLLSGFLSKKYISSFELSFIQTMYRPLIKYNSKPGTRSRHLQNKSYLFGFIEERTKGYRYIQGKVVKKRNSEYEVKGEDIEFIKSLINLFKDIDLELITNKFQARSIKRFSNADVQNISPDPKAYIHHFEDSDTIKSFKNIQKYKMLIQYPSSKSIGEGRVYNRDWNNLSKVNKINLFPDYSSYDISTSIYQFLKEFAIEKDLSYTRIDNYIKNKIELRKINSKKDYNSLPFRIEKGTINIKDTFDFDLFLEISIILDNISIKLWHVYEQWERKVIKEFIKKNKLKRYITNHDEVLVHKSEEVSYIPEIFELETIEERLEYAKKENAVSIKEYIIRRDKRIAEEKRIEKLKFCYGILKRCKKHNVRMKYFFRIESLKVSNNENLIGKMSLDTFKVI